MCVCVFFTSQGKLFLCFESQVISLVLFYFLPFYELFHSSDQSLVLLIFHVFLSFFFFFLSLTFFSLFVILLFHLLLDFPSH